MAEYTPQPMRVPGCIPREMAQTLAPIQQFFKHIYEGDTLNITVNNATHINNYNTTEIFNAANLTGILSNVVIQSFIRIGTLAGTLSRDGTQTLTAPAGGDVTVSGYFVPEDRQAPSGARCGAVKFEGTWYAIVIDQCVEVAA